MKPAHTILFAAVFLNLLATMQVVSLVNSLKKKKKVLDELPVAVGVVLRKVFVLPSTVTPPVSAAR